MNRFLERAQPQPTPGLVRAGRFLWEVFWLPFWLGSTLPPPATPGRRERQVPHGDRTPAILHQLDALRGTIKRQRAGILLFRTLWLALAVYDLGLALRVLAGRPVSLWLFLGASLAVAGLGGALIARARPSRWQLARTLDRSFGLRERISTALETAQGGRLTGVCALQVVEATRVAGKVGEARAFRRHLPLREIVLAAIMGLLCLALLLALLLQGPGRSGRGTGDGPAPQGGHAPAEVGPQPGTAPGAGPSEGQGTGQQGQNGQAPGRPSAQGQRDLDAVAGALQDHAATREASDRLRTGDYPGAADALREAGRNAPNLSPQARRDLARDLGDAASRVGDPQLGRDLRETAGALERPDAAGAQSAFDRVASDVERQGQGQGANDGPGAPPPQGASGPTDGGGGPGASPQLPSDQKAQPAAGPGTPPLGTDGKPVELPKGSGNGPLIPSQGQGNRGAGGAPDPGSAGVGGGQVQQGDVGETGPDPNRVPLDHRDAVGRYFTPRPTGPAAPDER